jgi:hypothetical protein
MEDVVTSKKRKKQMKVLVKVFTKNQVYKAMLKKGNQQLTTKDDLGDDHLVGWHPQGVDKDAWLWEHFERVS